MKTRSQQYSEKAFEQISAALTTNSLRDDGEKKQYGSLCHNFPIMVLRSGLSQTTAYVWVKAVSEKKKRDRANNRDNDIEKTPQGLFLKHLSEITSKEEGEAPDAFQQRINRANLTEYQRLTRKVLAASIWYKRFAKILLGITGDDDDN